MPSLAELIGHGDTNVSVRQAVVTAAPTTGTAQIRIGGNTTDIAGVPFLAGVAIRNGMSVWVLQFGDNLLIIGQVSQSTAGSADGGAYFENALELYQSAGTPYIDFHTAANPAGDSNVDYRWRQIAYTDRIEYQIPGYVAKHIMYSDGEFDCHHIGVNGDNDSNVGVKITTGSGGLGLYFETVLSDVKISMYGSNDHVLGVRNSAMYFRNAGGWFQFETPNGSWAMIYGPTQVNAGERGLQVMGNFESQEVYSDGWFRSRVLGQGWYNNVQGAGLMANNQFGSSSDLLTQNNETMIIAHKTSQAGWATAGLESWTDASNGVPYITIHANGCCTSSWRKDANQSYMVVINSGMGCDTVYASAHSICSEEGRKHNISVIGDEYGLKQLRALTVKRFQYTPSSEDEIWGWEMWKHDRARGVWSHPPSEHMGWDDWHIGYMAEEMANLVPEVVGYYSDGRPKGIDYGNLVVVVVEAVKELANRIEDLEAKIGRWKHAAA